MKNTHSLPSIFSPLFSTRLKPLAGETGYGFSLAKRLFPVLQNRHTFSPVRVIVSPVLTAIFVSNRLIQSDWKLTK